MSAGRSTFNSVKEYVEYYGGTRVIEKVLISNNGNAAVKAIRSVRMWAHHVFGNDRAIQFVVMATPDDIQANAEFIRLADQFEEVPGGTNNHNYANVRLIVDIAQRTGVQAVWPGWGHASENPSLPESLSKVGIGISLVFLLLNFATVAPPCILLLLCFFHVVGASFFR